MTARYTLGILAVAGLFTGALSLHAQTAPLQITTTSLPAATTGAPYSQQLFTMGGLCSSNGTATSSIDAGALPQGLSITTPGSQKQWYLSGTPTTGGNYSFTVRLIWTYNRVNPVDTNCTDQASQPLTLTVQGNSIPNPNPNPNPNQTLAVDRPILTVSYRTGHFPPAADTVNVTSTGGPVAITAQSFTDLSGVWLSVTPQAATTPAALTINYSVSGLVQGTYTGHITVSSPGLVSLTIPVTLMVATDTSIVLQAAPTSLGFSSVLGGADPPGQAVKITVAGDNVFFQGMVTAAPPNGKWLSVSPTSGATPATLTVAVTAKDLAAGVYSGVVTMAVGGIPTSAVAIPVTFTIQAPAQRPAITTGGVVDAAGQGSAIAPGTWVSIFGTTLSATTRAWRDTDFVNGRLPTSLDGVSVTIDGKSAAVSFISPAQINVLAADDSTTGLVPVVVKNTLGTSGSALALQQTAAPALFQFPGTKYAVGEHADGSLLAQGISGTAARVGETIVLFGTGFGATQPAIPATDPVTAPLPLAHPEEFSLRIGGVDATVAYAGLISPGLYQFNVVVPQVAAGDQSVVAELRGLLSQSGLLLTVRQ